MNELQIIDHKVEDYFSSNVAGD